MRGLPTVRAQDIAARPPEQRWLVQDLWGERAVGIVGGEPKCCKSFLALDLAVSVASGTPCLRRFAVPAKGRVLLFAAEDALAVVRTRLEGIACAAGLDLPVLDIDVITAPTVRLDLEHDRRALETTVQQLRPRLLVLDPFVRLHRVDENASGEVAPLLAFLRELERRYALAVILVHHARKAGGKMRGGQALRGSSEFHAWGDSNLYLRRHRDRLTLSVEHRAAASIEALELALSEDEERLALEIVGDGARAELPSKPLPQDRVLDVLRSEARPMTRRELRARAGMRSETLGKTVDELMATGRLVQESGGYRLNGIKGGPDGVSIPRTP